MVKHKAEDGQKVSAADDTGAGSVTSLKKFEAVVERTWI